MLKASIFDELESIFPDTPVDLGALNYQTDGVNGGYAGIHIMVSGAKPGIPVSIQVTGKNRCYKLFELLPLPVEVNTGAKMRTEYLKNDYNENTICRAPFYVYDVLKPIYNILIPKYESFALAFRVPVEYCIKETSSKWELTISSGEEHCTLNYTVNEYPLSISDSSKEEHKYINWISYSSIAKYYHVELWSEDFWSLYQGYLKAAVYSRQNMINIDVNCVFDMDSNGMPVIVRERLDRLISCARQCGISYFQGGAMTTRAMQLDENEFACGLDDSLMEDSEEIEELYKKQAFYYFDNVSSAKLSLNGEQIPGEKGEICLRKMCRELFSYIKDNNLCDNWIQCCLDEPNETLAVTYRKIVKIVRDEMKNIPIMEPVLTDEALVGTVDIWCPDIKQYSENREFYSKRCEMGEKLYVYACLTPGGNYCNRLLDMERIRQVYIGWAPAKYTEISGFLHWGGASYSNEGPYNRQGCCFSEDVMEYHPKHAMFLPAGDGAIFFPGINSPYVCTRSEAHRIGFEDLSLLKQVGDKDFLQKLINKVFRAYNDYEKDISTYRNVRRELIEYLMNEKKLGGKCNEKEVN